jgi:hypothetical protein
MLDLRLLLAPHGTNHIGEIGLVDGVGPMGRLNRFPEAR